MKVSKNKIVKLMIPFFLGIGITIAEFQNNMPEDKSLSSGYSVVRGNMAKIDNYSNVLNYQYKSIESDNFQGRNLLLKNISFSFLDYVDLDAFPDITQDSIINAEITYEEKYPQGLCVTEEYIFVTSYTENKAAFGECMIFDRITGEHLITLGMDKNSHLGGIAFDGENIWVCNSSKMAIERLSYNFIHHIVKHSKSGFVNVTNLVEVYRVKNVPSGITYQNGVLYVVTHSKWTDSKMVSYTYDKASNTLQREFLYKIPSKVQGIAFDGNGEVYLSTSYGRKNSSYLKKYTSIYAMTRDVEAYVEKIEMPPCSEGICIFQDTLYVLFESAGKKYLEGTDGNGKSIAPLDKILLIDLT